MTFTMESVANSRFSTVSMLIITMMILSPSARTQMFDLDDPGSMNVFVADLADPGKFFVGNAGVITDTELGLVGTSQYTDPLCAVSLGASGILVAWRTTSSIVFERWTATGTNLTLSDTLVRPVAGDTLRVLGTVLFDNQNGMLLWFDNVRPVVEIGNLWSASTLSQITWNPLVTDTEIPGLGAVRVDLLTWIPLSTAPNARVPFLGEQAGGQARWGAVLHGAPGPVAVEILDLYASNFHLLPRQPFINWAQISEGDMSVDVIGQVGDQVEFVRVTDGCVLGSGALLSSSSANSLSLSEPLEIGERYGIRFVGGPSLACIRDCPKKYFNTLTTPAGLSFLPISAPHGVTIGNLNFSVSCSVVRTPASSAMFRLDNLAIAGLAARGPGGSDPVLIIPGAYLLDPSAGMLVPSHGYCDASGRGRLTVDLPIPNDPQLIGLVLLYQLAIDDGTGLALSDIVGTKIDA